MRKPRTIITKPVMSTRIHALTRSADLLNLYENWILDINQTTGIAG